MNTLYYCLCDSSSRFLQFLNPIITVMLAQIRGKPFDKDMTPSQIFSKCVSGHAYYYLFIFRLLQYSVHFFKHGDRL